MTPHLPLHDGPVLLSVGHPCTELLELFLHHHTSTVKRSGEVGEKMLVM